MTRIANRIVDGTDSLRDRAMYRGRRVTKNTLVPGRGEKLVNYRFGKRSTISRFAADIERHCKSYESAGRMRANSRNAINRSVNDVIGMET
jgi:hypothetical protein